MNDTALDRCGRKHGVTITNPERLQSCWNEAERVEKAKDELARAFLTGKTLQELRMYDARIARRWRMAGAVAMAGSAGIALWLVVYAFWKVTQ